MAVFKHVDFEVPNWGELTSGPMVWASYQQQLMSLGPMTYWRLGEAPGSSTAVDETGAHDGTCHGDMTLGQSGAIMRDRDTSALFSTTGYVDVGILSYVDAVSIVAWVKRPATTSQNHRLLGSYAFPGKYSTILAINVNASYLSYSDGQITLEVRDNQGLSTGLLLGSSGPSSVFDDTWHMVAATGSSQTATVTIFLDGVAQPITYYRQHSPTPFTLRYPLFLGGLNNQGTLDQTLDGLLDEVAIFDRVLSAAEVLDLYRRGQAEVFLTG